MISFLWNILGQDQNLTDEQKWSCIRNYRNELLSRCDWTQLPDAPLTSGQKQLWDSYRQTLRDIPQSYTNPDSVVFPDTP